MGLEQGVQNMNSRNNSNNSGGTKDYELLDNKPQVNGIELTGNKTSEELGITGATLYDIKTLAQAIANKGWCCISQDKTIAKSDIPVLAADLQKKFNGVDKQESWVQKWNTDNSCNFVYHQGYYYYVFGGARNWSLRLYRTTSLDVEGTDISGQIAGRVGITKLLLYDKYIIGFDNINDGGIFFVYNLDTNSFHNFGSSLDIRGSNINIIDNFLICRKYNGWSLDLQYIWEENLSQYIISFSEDAGNLLATNKIGNTYYNVNLWGKLCSGSIYSNCANELASTADGTLFEKDNKCFYVGRNETYIYQDTTQIAHYTHNLVDIIGGNNGYYSCVSGNNIFMWNNYSARTIAISVDNGATWSNYSSSAFPTLTDRNKILYEINGNLICNTQIDDDSFDVYIPEEVATEYTDTINGVSQVYYYNSTYKMKFAKDTSNKSAIVNSVGYWNYFYMGETDITLPQNNNLWTWLYVGDDYVESSIPSGQISKKANVLYGTSAPTTETVANLGDIYIDTTNVAIYILAGISGTTYTWKQVSVVA